MAELGIKAAPLGSDGPITDSFIKLAGKVSEGIPLVVRYAATLDTPRNKFIIAGDAWQMCRARGTDPTKFGLTHVHLQGLWFIAGNVLRDLASLNRMEMLPWDVWGAMDINDDALTDEKKALLDRVAALTLAGDDAFADVRAIYESDDRLRVPPVVFNALRNASEPIAAI